MNFLHLDYLVKFMSNKYKIIGRCLSAIELYWHVCFHLFDLEKYEI